MPVNDNGKIDMSLAEEVKIRLTWKGISSSTGKTARLGFEIHESVLTADRMKELFNEQQLSGLITTRADEQLSLLDEPEDTISLDVVAETKSYSTAGPHYSGGLTFTLSANPLSDLAEFVGKPGFLIVTERSSIPDKPRAAKDEAESGSDRQLAFPAMDELSPESLATELAALQNDKGKLVLSEKVAIALATNGVKTCGDFQDLMNGNPEYWQSVLKDKTAGLGEAMLQKLNIAYANHMIEQNNQGFGLRLCTNCGAVHSDEKCPSCQKTFFEAIDDETLNADHQWEVGNCDREVISEFGAITAETLIHKCEFGFFHPGALIELTIDEDNFDQHVRLPTIAGNRMDEVTAKARALELLLDELSHVAGLEEYHDSCHVEYFQSCIDEVAGMIPGEAVE